MEHTDIVLSALIGIGLAVACGFRIFVPLLISSIGLKMGWIHADWVTDSFFKLLSSPMAIAIFSIATVTEIVAYKIPYFDHILDVLGTPVAIIAGTVLSSSFFVGIEDPLLRYALAIISGGASAGVTQGVTSLLRLGTTKTTGGLGNPFFAVIELITSTVLSVISIFLPILAILFFALFLFISLFLFKKIFKKKAVNRQP